MRQILDLRTQAQRQGISRTQQTAQAIADILKTTGKAAQVWRERQTLDRITRAISEGATTVEAIAAATRQEPQFSTGIPGALQRFGGAFQPSTGGMQQAIIGNVLQQALEQSSPLYQSRLQSEKARTAYWSRPKQVPTPSPVMKMVKEGLLTLEEGKGLARKDEEGNLTEKDIISIMHTIERALASTYTVLNEPISGAKYAERRNYYAQQLDIYRKRLDELRAERTPSGLEGEEAWHEIETEEAPTEPTAETKSLTMPKAPRPELEDVWPKLSDEQKSKVTRALMNKASIEEIKAALSLEGIK